MTAPQTMSLVADIGGTNSRVGLAGDGALLAGSIRRYRNAEYADFDAVLRAYLAEAGGPALSGIAVAVAGPVRDGGARLTNLDWGLSEAGLAHTAGAPHAALLNDLQAQGHALGRIDPGCLRPLIVGAPQPAAATRLVIGLGTGFNAAAVHDTPGGRLVTASECGHAGLPVRDADDLALSRHLEREHGFAAIEEVLSGRGLEKLDAWRGGPGAAKRDAAAIMEAMAQGEPRAQGTARALARLLGAVAGDLALIHLPFGGIWLAGGVARAMAPHLADLGFANAFRDKGRFAGFMEQFSVAVIEDDYAALTGCAACLQAIAGPG
jgi:glucokinase